MYIFKHSLFRLKITVGCLTSTYPSIHFSLDEDTLKITVGCLVCCVVCVVVCCGGVLWWCVVKLGTLSLSLLFSLLPLLFPFLFLSYLSFSLFFFFFFFSCSFSYSCSCSCSFSFSSSFFPSTHSSLPFTPTNTVQSTDQQTRRPTLRRLNVMWRTVRS